MFNYIIAGEGSVGIPVKSEMLPDKLADYIRAHSRRLHPKGNDVVCYLFSVEGLVNPRVMSPNDYANYCPFIL
jgi:hypothetical protein